ncbi:hypothetical protein I5U56_00725 [Stenotrophomonas maltophilia]|uniref:hypothetical protein n=1 Tax=Stenotrophomonas forensis TaxID=2871169 RepID=UPI0018D4761D|nr:hypothetical protein [Stenotrophomonas maltophilia]MBH1599222.1 hypothetical protein [Stenotrophomonas maltophilia]
MVKQCVERGQIVAADPDSNDFFHIVGNEVVLFPHVDSCAAVMVKTTANGYYLYHSLFCEDVGTPGQTVAGEVVNAMLAIHPVAVPIERTVVIASDAWKKQPELPVALAPCHVNYCSKAIDIELNTGTTQLRIREYSGGPPNAWGAWLPFVTFTGATVHDGT